MVIEIEKPRGEVIARIRQNLRGPAEHRRGTPHHQGRRGADGETALRRDAVAGRKGGQSAVEPARRGMAQPRKTALQHVLPVEMRAFAIARGSGMHHQRLTSLEQPGKGRHGRMESEESIQGQGRMRPVERQGDIAMQCVIVGVTDRRHGREPVQRATQHEHDQARIPCPGRSGKTRQIGPSEQGTAGQQDSAAGGMRTLAQ